MKIEMTRCDFDGTLMEVPTHVMTIPPGMLPPATFARRIPAGATQVELHICDGCFLRVCTALGTVVESEKIREALNAMRQDP